MLEALAVLEGEARLAASSDALLGGFFEGEAAVASFANAVAVLVKFPALLA